MFWFYSRGTQKAAHHDLSIWVHDGHAGEPDYALGLLIQLNPGSAVEGI